MKQFWHSWGRWLALLAACTGIFAAAFGLYHLPVAAALYPSALCGLLMLCVGGYDVWKRRQKLRMLHALAALPDDLPERLTAFEGEEDAAYEAIICRLVERENQLRQQTLQREQERSDYYTTWVHQIKTPIAAMHLLLENEDTPFSRSVGEELQRIEQYAQMVLTYQRLDSVDTDYVFRTHFSLRNGPPGMACMTKKVMVITTQTVNSARRIRLRIYKSVFVFIQLFLSISC